MTQPIADAYVGVDPGQDGAVAILDRHGRLVRVMRPKWAPAWPGVLVGSDFRDALSGELVLRAKMSETGMIVVTIEQPIPRTFGRGSTSVVYVALSTGAWAATLASLCPPKTSLLFIRPKPITWQRRILGPGYAGTSKDRARIVAEGLFHGPALEAGRMNNGILHDGVADACLLAEYGRQEAVAGAIIGRAR